MLSKRFLNSPKTVKHLGGTFDFSKKFLLWYILLPQLLPNLRLPNLDKLIHGVNISKQPQIHNLVQCSRVIHCADGKGCNITFFSEDTCNHIWTRLSRYIPDANGNEHYQHRWKEENTYESVPLLLQSDQCLASNPLFTSTLTPFVRVLWLFSLHVKSI